MWRWIRRHLVSVFGDLVKRTLICMGVGAFCGGFLGAWDHGVIGLLLGVVIGAVAGLVVRIAILVI